jgi:pimeloyl-ACP methyl ester carboxylesterase
MSTLSTRLQTPKLSILLSLAILNTFCGGNQTPSPSPTPSPTVPPQGLPPQCTAGDVHHYELPIYWGRANSPTFTYSFQLQAATVGNPTTAPFGIMINGGAGAPSIGYASGTVFPASFNVIYTDVRGVGCNINSANPFRNDALTTEFFALDTLSIVQVLRLREYVLYGVSYGTVQATVMAYRARNAGIQTPTAVVLEGILGNWQLNNTDVADLNKQWTKAQALLPANVVATFFQSPQPFGIPTADWTTFISYTLSQGMTPALGNSTVHYLTPLGSGDLAVVAQARRVIQAKVAEIRDGIKPEMLRLATVLHCTETEGSVHDRAFINGRFVETGSDICPALGLQFIKPYDSAQYPLDVPIYYFEGADDPTTSPENAKYHFDNQTRADRVFTLIGDGGHTALSGTLRETGCTPAIYDAILSNPSRVSAAIRECGWPVEITTRAAR